MITNNTITYYHKVLNQSTKLEQWVTYYFNDVWVFGGKGSSVNKGYENANDVDVRIPMEYIEDRSIFKVGDVIVIGQHNDIKKQSDLNDTEFYNIKSININDFGNNPHIHLGGK